MKNARGQEGVCRKGPFKGCYPENVNELSKKQNNKKQPMYNGYR